MNNYTFTDRNGKHYKRIDKRTARACFDKYINIILCPVNIRPFNDFCPVWLELNHKLMNELDNNKTFDNIVNEYAYYNCTGNKKSNVAFYVAID